MRPDSAPVLGVIATRGAACRFAHPAARGPRSIPPAAADHREAPIGCPRPTTPGVSSRTAGCGPWSRPVVVERDGAVAAFPAPRAAGPGQGVTAIGGMRRGRALFFDNAGRRREEIEVFVSLWRRLAIPESLTR